MFILLKKKKYIFPTISMLMLTNQNISSKNQILLCLFQIENPAMTIIYVLKVKP